MLTSRSEYRLALRSDNADARLTPIGKECNLIDDARFKMFEDKRDTIENELARLKKFRLKESSPLVAAALEQSKISARKGKQSFTLEELWKTRRHVRQVCRIQTRRWNRRDSETSDKMGSRVRGNSRQVAGFIQRQKVQMDRDLSKQERNSIGNRLQGHPDEVRSERKARKSASVDDWPSQSRRRRHAG